MARRGLRRHRNKRNVKVVVVSAIALLFVMTVGYAAFSTNVSLNAKGNLIKLDMTATEVIKRLHAKGDPTLIDDGTTDHNIRYSGKNVNNYVCMDSTESPCSDDNLYRIIGVFNNIKSNEQGTGVPRVKLVKATLLSAIPWDDTMDNNWARPASLNTTLNSLPIASNNLIDDAVWHLGTDSNAYHYTNEYYVFERGTVGCVSSPEIVTWVGKVALMYPSDYGYASSACYSTTNLITYSNSNCTGSNWLFLEEYEWLITPSNYHIKYAYAIMESGYVHFGGNDINSYSEKARPAVYLKANVKIKENNRDGSLEKPYLLELPN